MKLTIISVGKKSGSAVAELCDAYEKRLPRNIETNWQFIDHAGNLPEARRKEEESKRIARFCKDSLVVLLDDRGSQLDNNAFANEFQQWEREQHRVTFVIGGAYGVNPEVIQPDFTLSLSKLVFPHELVRVMLIEQIYRASAINRGLPYHHE